MKALDRLSKEQKEELIYFMCVNDKEDLAQMYLELCSDKLLKKIIEEMNTWRSL